MLKRKWPALLVVLGILVAMIGCNSKPADPATSGTTPAPATKEVTLTIWNAHTTGNVLKVLDGLNKAFEKENPGVKVNMTTYNWNDLPTKWAPGIASGTVPDISNVQPQHMTSLASGGHLAPLDDVIAAKGGDAAFVQSYLKGHKMADGHYYGVPQLVSPFTLFYRKDLLEKAGVAVPKTWNDLLEILPKLNSPPNQYAIITPAYHETVLHAWFATNKSYTLGPKGEVVFNSPETVETFKFLSEVSKFEPPGWTNFKSPDVINALLQGKVVMASFWMDFLAQLETDKPELVGKIGATTIPVGKEPASTTVGASWAVFKQGGHVELAKKYVEFMLRKENMTTFLQDSGGGWMPPTQELNNDANFWKAKPYVTFPEVYKVLQHNAEIGTIPEMVFGAWPWSGDVWGTYAVVKELQAVVSQNKDPQKAAADAAAVMSDVVNKYKK